METTEKSGRTAIGAWRRRVEEVLTEADGLLTQAPAERWNTKPSASEDWTAAQHIEHLCIVTALVTDKIEAALASDPPKGNPDDWKPGWFSKMFIKACGPQPTGRATPAPPLFLPGDGPFDPVALRQRFSEIHARYLSALARSEDVDVSRVTIPSAAMPLLRVSLGTWFEAMAVHIAYHVSRARNLLK